jgi:hypothetical protein
MKRLIAVFPLLLITALASATIIHVPGDYPTIQGACDAASYGDTVLVAPGTYFENVQLTGGVHAENLTLMGSGWENTTIDGMGLYNTLYVYEVSNITIEGFTVRNAQQGGSAPGNVGIHLNPISSSGTKIVRNCRATHNGHGIDIWNDFGGVAYIENNVIDDNLYNGFGPYLGTVYLTNNTIVDNGQDGYNDWSGGGAIYIKNNIIANNGRYGIYKHLNTPVFISYNDVWNNVEGAYYQGYSGPAQPFTPNPGTGEIAADPLFYGSPFDYYLSWDNFPTPDLTMSPCIDAGDPTLPYDPDGTIADQGAFYFDQTWHDVDVMLTPYSPPIIIPSGGGSFDFDISIRNLELNVVEVDAWIMAELPGGSLYGPVLGPVTVSIASAGMIERSRTQLVPGSAPPGSYEYLAFAGVFPTTIWSEASFVFEKSATDDGGQVISDWFNDGDEFKTVEEPLSIQPAGFGMLTAYPNPFNPTTTISYNLAEPARVKLSVYNVSGQVVADIANGWREKGTHEVTFDALSLPSGVYIIHLNTKDVRLTQKIMLVK